MENPLKKYKNKFQKLFREFNSFNKKYSVLTSINLMIVGKKRDRASTISFIHGFPAYYFITIFLILRKDEITFDWLTIFLIYFGTIWAWIGPVFIWRFETITVRKFFTKLSSSVKNKNEFYKLKRYSMVSLAAIGPFRKVLLSLWCVGISVSFFSNMII